MDLYLYDWKESDPGRHAKSCGASNAGILANLRALHADGKDILLRCPIVPGINDRPDHFRGIADLAQSLPGLKGVELLAYHRLGESKVNQFGLEVTARAEADAPRPEVMGEWIRTMRQLGVQVVNEELDG